MQYITYRVPECVCCGRDISREFKLHLETKHALPGFAGTFRCPRCGEMMEYILSEQVTVDVLPVRRPMP